MKKNQNKIIKNPKGITYHATYEPDMDRMVKALSILLGYNPPKKSSKERFGQ